jgi:hypothetical protein
MVFGIDTPVWSEVSARDLQVARVGDTRWYRVGFSLELLWNRVLRLIGACQVS